MDNTEEFTAIEFCAGYGGICLGLGRAIENLRVIAYSEIEAYACAVLVKRMEEGLLDPAPVWTDLKTFPGEQFHGKVDILTAGYPCQPFSSAGKRAGKEVLPEEMQEKETPSDRRPLEEIVMEGKFKA